MTVELEKETAIQLILHKKRSILTMTEDILERWNETSVEEFLTKARNGHHKNAENDAIDMRQLLIEEEKLNKLLDDISGDN